MKIIFLDKENSWSRLWETEFLWVFLKNCFLEILCVWETVYFSRIWGSSFFQIQGNFFFLWWNRVKNYLSMFSGTMKKVFARILFSLKNTQNFFQEKHFLGENQEENFFFILVTCKGIILFSPGENKMKNLGLDLFFLKRFFYFFLCETNKQVQENRVSNKIN